MYRCLLILLLSVLSLPVFSQYNIKKMMEEGKRTFDQGYYVASMQIFTRIVALKPHLYEAWYLMALSKYHLEDYKGAEEDCKVALALQPYVSEIFELYGMVCICEEKYDSAFIAYTQAAQINPDNRELWYNKAYCLYMQNDFSSAQRALDYIIKRWPTFQEANELAQEIKSNKRPKQMPRKVLNKSVLNLSSLSKKTLLMQKTVKNK